MAHNMRILPSDAFSTAASVLMVPYSFFPDASGPTMPPLPSPPVAENGDFLAFYDLSTLSLLRTVHPFPSTAGDLDSGSGLCVHEYLPTTRQIIFGIASHLCALDPRSPSPALSAITRQAHAHAIASVQVVSPDAGRHEVLTQTPGEVKIWDLRKPTAPVFASGNTFPGHPLFHSSLWVVDRSSRADAEVVISAPTSPTTPPRFGRSTVATPQLELWAWNPAAPLVRPILCAELSHEQHLLTEAASTVKLFDGTWLTVSFEGGVAVWKVSGTSHGHRPGERRRPRKAKFCFDIPTGEGTMPFVDYDDSLLVTGDERVRPGCRV